MYVLRFSDVFGNQISKDIHAFFNLFHRTDLEYLTGTPEGIETLRKAYLPEIRKSNMYKQLLSAEGDKYAELLLNVDQEAEKGLQSIKGVKIIPANDDLIGLDVSAVTRGVAEPMALRYFLDDNADRFDWCIIDCPPAFSAGAMAAIAAADELVVPMKVDAFGVNGVKSLMAMLENMRRINPDLELAGVLPTMVYQDKQQLEALNVLRTQLGIAAARAFRCIRRSPLVDRSTFSQEPLIYCSPKSKTLYDYRVFVHQLIGDQEGGEK